MRAPLIQVTQAIKVKSILQRERAFDFVVNLSWQLFALERLLWFFFVLFFFLAKLLLPTNFVCCCCLNNVFFIVAVFFIGAYDGQFMFLMYLSLNVIMVSNNRAGIWTINEGDKCEFFKIFFFKEKYRFFKSNKKIK